MKSTIFLSTSQQLKGRPILVLLTLGGDLNGQNYWGRSGARLKSRKVTYSLTEEEHSLKLVLRQLWV